MIDISKIDDKNISFNGKTCAAVYKADAGADDKGEFIVIKKIGRGYSSKIRIEDLTINSIAQRSADSAAIELNQFIGNFKKGGNGGNVKTVNYRVPDANGNIQLTALDIGAAATSYVDIYTYKKLRIGSHTSTSGYLVKLRDGTVADGTVVRIVGYSSYGKPINTMFQFVATRVAGQPPAIRNVMGYSYGYELKAIRIFAMRTGSNVYSVFLWIPSVSGTSHMGVSVFDSAGGVSSGLGNLITSITIEPTLPADSERFNEVALTPASPFPVEGSWTPSLTGVSSTTHSNSFFTKVGSLVRCQTQVTAQVAGDTGAVQLTGLPYPVRTGLGWSNQYPIDLSASAALKNVANLIGFMGTFSSDNPYQMSIAKVVNTEGNISYAEVYGSDVTPYTTFRFRFDYLAS